MVTGDETQSSYSDAESKEVLSWKLHNYPLPGKLNTASAGKVMATIVLVRDGALLIDYLPHKIRRTGTHYGQVPVRLRYTIKTNRSTTIPQQTHPIFYKR